MKLEPGFNLTSEQAHDPEKVLDHMLEQVFISEAAVKINEGNNGIILELNTADLPTEVRDYFLHNSDIEDNEDEDDDKIAVKILKIYTGTVGRHEYQMQKKARQILIDEKVEGVKIPKARNFREVVIEDEEVTKHLEAIGIKLGQEKIIEIIAMDLIPGRDLATIIYEAYVRLHQADFKQAYPEFEVEVYLKQIDMNGLIELVHKLAGIKNKYSNFDESFEANQERAQIAKILSEQVAYTGLLDPQHAKNMLQAVNTLHKHGLYHHDLHARNIMFDEDGNLEIIDFGSAVEIKVQGSLDTNRVSTKDLQSNRLSDDGIIIILQKLATTAQDLQHKVIETALGQPEVLLEKLAIKRAAIWSEFIISIEQGESLDKIFAKYERSFGAESDRKVRIALLLEIAKHHRQAEVVTYLQTEIAKNNLKRKGEDSTILLNQYTHLLKLLNA